MALLVVLGALDVVATVAVAMEGAVYASDYCLDSDNCIQRHRVVVR